MTDASQALTREFFAATCALACHTGSLQQRLADAYADHLLQVVANDLPAELRTAFREVEQRLTAADSDEDDDPFRAAAGQLNDDEARALITHRGALRSPRRPRPNAISHNARVLPPTPPAERIVAEVKKLLEVEPVRLELAGVSAPCHTPEPRDELAWKPLVILQVAEEGVDGNLCVRPPIRGSR